MKLLLLSDIPPTRNYAGGLVLDQLCRFLPKGSVACYSIVYPGAPGAELSADLDWIPIKYRDKPREYWGLYPQRPRLNKIASFFGETYHRLVTGKAIEKDILEFAREQGVDAVWCVLEGQTVIRQAAPVAAKLGVPLYTEIWDPPNWWLQEHMVDRFTAKQIMGAYRSALETSTCCYAVSPNMAEEYGREYGVKTATFLPSLNDRVAFPPAKRSHDRPEFVIGIAGQNYLSQEWNSLFTALDSVDWKIAGRDIRMRIMSRELTLSAVGKKRNVEYLGWRSQEETVKLLSETDVGYCPYWFSPDFEAEARLCFPSKLTAYLASGRPVLFHGPDYASPARFLRENDAGVLCHSLEPGTIVNCLEQLISDDATYERLATNGRAAFDTYLTERSLRKSFAEFLGIPESTLVGEQEVHE